MAEETKPSILDQLVQFKGEFELDTNGFIRHKTLEAKLYDPHAGPVHKACPLNFLYYKKFGKVTTNADRVSFLRLGLSDKEVTAFTDSADMNLKYLNKYHLYPIARMREKMLENLELKEV